ncbi:M48 family metallopeptidase [Streptomyces sp. NPDC126514]|uniref:M48 family metallopeptidase n=1 Tax=Streptomyces sp. NPDC126514 TaxID=3155210 RepID=UPI003322D8F7
MAVAVSALMHLLTGALVVGGTLLIIFGWATIIQPVLGLLLICLAVQLRPRRGTVDGERPLRRADAPQLFALVDEVAHGLGTRTVDVIQCTHRFEIRAVPFGMRRRRLEIGLALWELLTPQQRIACLAHELGHFATGDVRHHMMVRTVLPILHSAAAPSESSATLREQALATSPVSRRADEMAHAAARFRVDSALSGWAIWLATWPHKQMARLVQGLAASVAEEVEYRSDGLAAQVASTEAAVQALQCRGLSGVMGAELRRLAVEARTFDRPHAAEGLWQKLAAYAGEVSGDTLPRDVPQVRIDALSAAPQYPAMVTLDRSAAEGVERELEPGKRAVAQRFIRDSTALVR